MGIGSFVKVRQDRQKDHRTYFQDVGKGGAPHQIVPGDQPALLQVELLCPEEGEYHRLFRRIKCAADPPTPCTPDLQIK